MPDLPDSVAVDSTALAVAACRAIESSRTDALVVDPYAAALAAAAGGSFPLRWPATGESHSPFDEPLLLASIYIGLRTRFIDDVIAAHPVSQIVILGAGLDSRGFRLAWPDDSTLFELDTAATFEHKSRVLRDLGVAAAVTRVEVAVDFREDWLAPLVESGFSSSLATLWVVEGLFPYLDADAQAAALSVIDAQSGSGSVAVIERAVGLVDGPDLDEKLSELHARTGVSISELLARTDPPDPAVMLADHWTVDSVGIGDLEVTYGRPLSLDPTHSEPVGAGSRGGFVVAVR